MFVWQSHSQIVSGPVTPDVSVDPSVSSNNTGLAVSPGNQAVYATVYETGSNYEIRWLNSTGTTYDSEVVPYGADPDVAYYAKYDNTVVVYTNNEDHNVYIDNYYLNTPGDITNGYSKVSEDFVGPGRYPNVDIASNGYGIVSWEVNNAVFVRPFKVTNTGIFLGPTVFVNTGKQPDVVILDHQTSVGSTYSITYITPSGDLAIESYNYNNLTAGLLGPTIAPYTWPLTSGPEDFSFPRIAADRNSNFGANLDNFTVVAQYGSKASIYGFFNKSGAQIPVIINPEIKECKNYFPVVTYDRSRVRIAWTAYYFPSCNVSGISGTENVLLREYDYAGNLSPFYLGGMYKKINMSLPSTYGGVSIASEYDGAYTPVTNSTFHEGMLWSGNGIHWKYRQATSPLYKTSETDGELSNNVVQLLENPIQYNQIKLRVNGDYLPLNFALYDELGRSVSVDVVHIGNEYILEASNLQKGLYLIKYNLNQTTHTLKVVK